MKAILIIVLLFVNSVTIAQNNTVLIQQSKLFHQMLVTNDTTLFNYLDEQISYGHSNGWIETKQEIIEHLQSKLIVYNNIIEDSVTQVINGKLGYVRFKGSFNVTLQGKQSTFTLKVLEVWRKRKGRWVLFARQAIRLL